MRLAALIATLATLSFFMTGLLGKMSSAAPLMALALALGALCWSGAWRTHRALVALLAYDLSHDVALSIWPQHWSVIWYIASGCGICLGVVGVALEAGRRCRDWGIVSFQVLMLVGSAFVGGAILDKLFTPATTIRSMVRLHFAAGAAAGVVVGSLPVDVLSYHVLRWLFVTRMAQALRLALLEIGPDYSAWAGGVATVAWCVTCFWITYHCVAPPASAQPPQAHGPTSGSEAPRA